MFKSKRVTYVYCFDLAFDSCGPVGQHLCVLFLGKIFGSSSSKVIHGDLQSIYYQCLHLMVTYEFSSCYIIIILIKLH
jgi:hypothetical protein